MSTASILAAASNATVQSFGAITSTATLVASSVNAAAALAQTLEAQATGFRDRSIKDIVESNKRLDMTTTLRAQVKVADAMLAIETRTADPKFSAMLARVQAEWDLPAPKFALQVAA